MKETIKILAIFISSLVAGLSAANNDYDKATYWLILAIFLFVWI